MELIAWGGLDRLNWIVKGCKNGEMLLKPQCACFVYVDRKWLVELIPWIKMKRTMIFQYHSSTSISEAKAANP